MRFALRFWIIAGFFSFRTLDLCCAQEVQGQAASGSGAASALPSEPGLVPDPPPSDRPDNPQSTNAAPLSQAAAQSVALSVETPPGTPAFVPSASEEYRVQPEDVLQITVYEEPDLSTKVRVVGSGEINFPLLGRVQVAGLSVIEVQEKIEKLLAEDYLVDPQVQVFIDAYHARNVFVTGAVNKPGSYPLPAGKITTLMEAIAMAGGFGEEAALNGTRIIRIENGKEISVRVAANDIIKKGDKTKDVEVRPNDVVFVPESFF